MWGKQDEDDMQQVSSHNHTDYMDVVITSKPHGYEDTI